MKKIVFSIMLFGLIIATSIYFTSQKTPSQLKLEKLTQKKEKGPKRDRPGEAAEWWALRTQAPNDESPGLLNYRIKNEYLSRQPERGATPPVALSFEDYGPGNFGGRTRAIAIHPTDPNQLVVAGVFGGIIKTTDGGQTWVPQADFITNLAISCIAPDPDNPDTLYVGTGEGFFNADAARGAGIFVSNDFGSTWAQLPSTANSDFHFVNRLAKLPSSDVLLAATRAGIFRSTNNGMTWNQVETAVQSPAFVDLKVDPSDPDVVVASHFAFSNPNNTFLTRSTDGGQTWNRLGAAEGLPTTGHSRTEIGWGTDGVVYAAISRNGDFATLGMWRSNNSGATWTRVDNGTTAFIERQGWYDLAVNVKPDDSDVVIVGAVDVFRSTDGGVTYSRESDWSPDSGDLDNYVHADIHTFVNHPEDPNIVFVGCDGGIFQSNNFAETFIDLNNDLRIAQNYGAATSPDGTRIITGTQDNGSHLYYGNNPVWLEWFGGDGGFCSWDQQDENFMYGSTPSGGLFGSSDRGNSTTGIPVPNDSYPFIQAFTIDPNDGNRFIIGGSRVHFTSNLRALGSATFTTDSQVIGTISSLTISPLNGSVAFAGTTAGTIFRTTSLGSGTDWTLIDPNQASGIVTWIEVDTSDASGNTVYATLGSYNGNRLLKSTDGGDSWTPISGNLPDMPLHCVRVDPLNSNRLFVGSELGLWQAVDEGGPLQWQQFDYGPAWTRITQLYFTNQGQDLWVVTHGRGLFKASRSPLDVRFDPFNDAECDNDGALDAGESAQLPVAVTNQTGYDLQNVTVTLFADYPNLTILTDVIPIGTLTAGETTTINFDVTLADLQNCLDTVDFTATLTYDGGIQTEMFSTIVGSNPMVMTGTLTEDAEDQETAFMAVSDLGTTNWSRVTTQANNGTSSWFIQDVPVNTVASLVSPWISADNAATAMTLSFALFYDMEGDSTQYWDGVVLELQVEGDSKWIDIGQDSSVPYDGRLFINNPIYSRQAWSGSQETWRNASVNLGTTYNNSRFRFRFRMGADGAAAEQGFWVDDIAITNARWDIDPVCDLNGCASCFNNQQEALDAIILSVGNGEWPDQQNMLDYVADLNNVCLP